MIIQHQFSSFHIKHFQTAGFIKIIMQNRFCGYILPIHLVKIRPSSTAKFRPWPNWAFPIEWYMTKFYQSTFQCFIKWATHNKNCPKILHKAYCLLIHDHLRTYAFFLNPRSPGSSVGLALVYWSSGPSLVSARGEIFSTINGVPLHTAFHYQPPIVPVWLEYCWKGRKIAIHPSIHLNLQIQCYIRKNVLL